MSGPFVSRMDLAPVLNNLNQRSNLPGLKTIPFGNSIITTTYPFANEAIWQASPTLMWVGNSGVAGNTSAQMLARVSDIPNGAQVVPFMEGPNDAGASVTVAQHYANMKAIAESFIARNMLPAIWATSPKDGSETLITAYLAAEYLVAYDLGISIFDPWGSSVDTSDGGWISGHTSDGTHPVSAWAKTAATNVAAQMLGTEPAVAFAPRSNAAGTAGYCLSGGNCFMLTDTNVDGVPDGWALVGSATASIVTAPGAFKGSFARVTGNAGGGFPYLRKQITASGNFAVGDQLLLSCVVATNVAASPLQAYLSLGVDGGTVEVIKQGHELSLAGQRIFFLFTPTTTSTVEVRAAVNNTGTGNWIEIGECEVYNLTAMRALA